MQFSAEQYFGPSKLIPDVQGTGGGGGGGGGGSWGGSSSPTPTASAGDPTGAAGVAAANEVLRNRGINETNRGDLNYLPPGSTPTGTFDTAAFQASQLERAKSELEAMAKTLADRETTTASAAVTSDEPEVNSEKSAIDTINLKEGKSPSREALDLLDSELAQIQQLLTQQERSINKSYDVLRTGTEGKQGRETGETSVGLASAGGYLGFSGSGQGVMLSLAKSHRDELLALEAQRQQAIMEAREAAANRRFDVVKLKASELTRIDQEIYDREQDYFKNKLALSQEERLQTQTMADINRMDMQDARDTIDMIMSSFGGLKKEELTPEYRETLEAMARKAGVPVEAFYQRLAEAPPSTLTDKDMTERTNLVLDATVGGAPADVIRAIGQAETLADAAVLAQPYIKKQPAGKSVDKINYSGRGFYYDSERDIIENNLRSSRVTANGDPDGYWADPTVYEETLDAWIANELAISDFEENFPVQTFIRPEDVDSAPPRVREMYQSYEARKASLLTGGDGDANDANGNGIPDSLE